MRTFAIGDPQAAFATVMDVLRAHDLLDGERLASDVHLISIGDHFDYDFDAWETSQQEGLRTLRWLASHDPDQVTILVGNHDISRVQELATITDDEFAAARALGREVGRDPAKKAEFRARFPDLPTHGLPSRDYASFSTEQRALVIELLERGRMQLATTRALGGRRVLLTHAGVTERELAILGIPDERDPDAIAGALDAHLRAAIARSVCPLDLAPLHVAGRPGEEGGGLLYHRPSNPDRPNISDKAWSWNVERPRRFDPRTLPRGLAQVAGHSGHNKCLEELGDWATDAAKARPRGGIRTLAWDGTAVTYDLGVAPHDPARAQLYLIDGEMRRVAPADYSLLAFD